MGLQRFEGVISDHLRTIIKKYAAELKRWGRFYPPPHQGLLLPVPEEI